MYVLPGRKREKTVSVMSVLYKRERGKLFYRDGEVVPFR